MKKYVFYMLLAVLALQSAKELAALSGQSHSDEAYVVTTLETA